VFSIDPQNCCSSGKIIVGADARGGKVVTEGWANVSQLAPSDLGRLAPGAKADIVIVNLRTTRYGPVRDPINALVEYGSGADVETVIVDGEVVVDNGRSTRIDDDELFGQAQAGATRAWDNWAARDWHGRSVEQIIPPAFPTRKN
jgi:imidazolonepropionase-like amidohydrolase